MYKPIKTLLIAPVLLLASVTADAGEPVPFAMDPATLAAMISAQAGAAVVALNNALPQTVRLGMSALQGPMVVYRMANEISQAQGS